MVGLEWDSYDRPRMGDSNGTQGGRGPRVIMLVPRYPPEWGGAGEQAELLARALTRLGVEVRVLTRGTTRSDPPGYEREARVEVLRFGSPRADRLSLLLGLRAAVWLLLHSDWELLHVHGLYYYGVLPALAARLRRRRVLAKTTLAEAALPAGAPLQARLTRRVYRRCDAVVALSSALEGALQRDGGFTGRILKIPNGVDTETFWPADAAAREAARGALGLPGDALIIVSVGRLEARKNLVGLVEAAARMRRRPLCVVLAGPPSPEPADNAALDRAIAALPAGVEVRRLGRVPTAALAELLRAADVFGFPSREEGMPNALLEAMASGLACVASDIPGSRDVLAEGGGILVPPGDGEALARALDALAADADERSRLGAEAVRIVERHYAIARVAERYVETYRDLGLRSPRPGSSPTSPTSSDRAAPRSR